MVQKKLPRAGELSLLVGRVSGVHELLALVFYILKVFVDGDEVIPNLILIAFVAQHSQSAFLYIVVEDGLADGALGKFGICRWRKNLLGVF